MIISVGPVATASEIEVPASLWCRGLCGQWLTYVVAEAEDA